jgi:regulatory protein
MPEMDDYKRLLSISLKLLSIRPRSTQEILIRLKKYSHDRDLINRILEQLKSSKFLDDEKFAAWVIESRSRTRPRGKRLLVQELKAKGIELSTFNSQLSTVDEADLAFKALQKKAKSWSNLSSKSYQLKAKSYLYARGFPWEVIEKAVKKAYNSDHVS